VLSSIGLAVVARLEPDLAQKQIVWVAFFARTFHRRRACVRAPSASWRRISHLILASIIC